MISEWLTTLREFGGSTYDTLAAAPPLPVFFTALSLPIVGWFILHFYRNVARNVEAVFRILAYRFSETLGGWKTHLVCRFRNLIPHRKSRVVDTTPQVEFDDLDFAVLRTAASLGPGFAINATELAERFSLRPAQVQRSLNKLSSNKMLDSIIGSTDGFDNYRLTQLGTAFMSTWQKQPGQA